MPQPHRMIARARPTLGTIVEIRVAESHRAHTAIEAAFSAVETVYRLMSAFNPNSDVGRLNAALPGSEIEVHPWTLEVLELAEEIRIASGGVFDVTRGTGKVALGASGLVSRTAEARVDLGGIAKGYAVDRAIEALQSNGVESGSVNAGGDIRIFGPHPQQVFVRTPAEPTRSIPFIVVREGAVASSGVYFQDDALVDPRTCAVVAAAKAVTVAAQRCAVADALTKVAYIIGDAAAQTLAIFDAAAWELRGGTSDLQIRALSDKNSGLPVHPSAKT